MKHVFAILGTAAAAIGLASLVVRRGGDRETLVPPPEAVAEGFVRELVTGRGDQAKELLSDALRDRVTGKALTRAGAALEGELGGVGNVFAETESISRDRAAVSTLLDGPRGRKTLRFALVNENGEWAIDRWNDALGSESGAMASEPVHRP